MEKDASYQEVKGKKNICQPMKRNTSGLLSPLVQLPHLTLCIISNLGNKFLIENVIVSQYGKNFKIVRDSPKSIKEKRINAIND